MTDDYGNPVQPSHPGSGQGGAAPYGQQAGAPYGQQTGVPYGQQTGAPYGGGPATNPGKTLGIVGLILGIVGFFIAFLAPIAGLIVSIIGLNRSKRAGMKNGPAVAGIIVSIVALIANIILAVVIAGFFAVGLDAAAQCEADPNGVVEVAGEQISCSEVLPAAP